MSRWNVILAITAVTLAGLSAMLYRGLLDERALRLDLAADLAALRESVIHAPIPGSATEAGGEQGLAPAPAPALQTVAVDASKRETALRQRAIDQHRERMRDPEYRAAMLAQQRLNLEMQFPNLAAELGLTPEQTERFLELMARHALAIQDFNMELSAQMFPEGVEPTPELRREYDRRRDAERERHEVERKLLLGEDKYQAWRDFVNSREARGQLQALRGRLSDSASPLHQDQVDQLVPLLTVEQQRYRQEVQALHETMEQTGEAAEMERIWERRVELLDESQQRALEALKPYMNGEQLEQLRNMQAADLRWEKNRLRMMRANRALQSRSDGQ